MTWFLCGDAILCDPDLRVYDMGPESLYGESRGVAIEVFGAVHVKYMLKGKEGQEEVEKFRMRVLSCVWHLVKEGGTVDLDALLRVEFGDFYDISRESMRT